MPVLYLYAIAAGLCSAVIFASATTGPVLARFLLFILTPLPIFLTGFRFGWFAAVIGGVVGSVIISVLAAPMVGVAFAVSQTIPAMILCYLALLNRPTDDGVEWYPVGRLVLWACAIGAALSIMSMLILGQDMDGLRTTIKTFLEKAISQTNPDGGKPAGLGDVDLDVMTNVTIQLLPAITAISIIGGLLFNLWLAGRVVLASGQLSRPWPDVATLSYPSTTPVMLVVSLVLASFLSGFPALVAGAVAGAVYFAYVLMGLAIIHYVTRGQALRPILLWLTYLSVLFMNTFATLVLAFIGLGEPISPLRRSLPTPSGKNKDGQGGSHGGPT